MVLAYDTSNYIQFEVSSSGDFTIDAPDDIRLDAGGGDIVLRDDGVEYGRLTNSSQDFIIQNTIDDKDIIIKGVDGGQTKTALTFDMSNNCKATFLDEVAVNGSLTAGAFVGLPLVDVTSAQSAALQGYLLNTISQIGTLEYIGGSDSRIKSNISNFTYGLDAIKTLTPKYYNYDKDKYDIAGLKHPGEGAFFDAQRVGLMADNVKSSMPEVTYKIDSTKDYEDYNKDAIVNALINAVKELSDKNDALVARVVELEGKL